MIASTWFQSVENLGSFCRRSIESGADGAFFDAASFVRRLTAIGDGRKGFSVIFRDEEHKVLAMYDIVTKGEAVTFEPVRREQDPEMFEYFDVVEQ